MQHLNSGENLSYRCSTSPALKEEGTLTMNTEIIETLGRPSPSNRNNKALSALTHLCQLLASLWGRISTTR